MVPVGELFDEFGVGPQWRAALKEEWPDATMAELWEDMQSEKSNGWVEDFIKGVAPDAHAAQGMLDQIRARVAAVMEEDKVVDLQTNPLQAATITRPTRARASQPLVVGHLSTELKEDDDDDDGEEEKSRFTPPLVIPTLSPAAFNTNTMHRSEQPTAPQLEVMCDWSPSPRPDDAGLRKYKHIQPVRYSVDGVEHQVYIEENKLSRQLWWNVNLERLSRANRRRKVQAPLKESKLRADFDAVMRQIGLFKQGVPLFTWPRNFDKTDIRNARVLHALVTGSLVVRDGDFATVPRSGRVEHIVDLNPNPKLQVGGPKPFCVAIGVRVVLPFAPDDDCDATGDQMWFSALNLTEYKRDNVVRAFHQSEMVALARDLCPMPPGRWASEDEHMTMDMNDASDREFEFEDEQGMQAMVVKGVPYHEEQAVVDLVEDNFGIRLHEFRPLTRHTPHSRKMRAKHTDSKRGMLTVSVSKAGYAYLVHDLKRLCLDGHFLTFEARRPRGARGKGPGPAQNRRTHGRRTRTSAHPPKASSGRRGRRGGRGGRRSRRGRK